MTGVLPSYVWEVQFGADSPYDFSDSDFLDDFYTGAEWTDVSEDVRTDPGPAWSRGMSGGSPEDRVAPVGQLSLMMNNFPKNAPRTLGYYTPGHTNCRTGWGLGHGFRLRVVYKDMDVVQFLGTLESVTPAPGEARSRHVDVLITDWMEEAATSNVEGLSTMLDASSDEVFTALLDSMTHPPVGRLVGDGLDTYAYALDSVRAEKGSVLQEFQRLAMSELGYIFLRADGTLVFQGRGARGSGTAENVYTFETDLEDISVTRSRTNLINSVRVMVNPRRRDASNVVLYSQTQPIQIAGGQVVDLRVSYTDPDQRGQRAGAVNIQPMVADTDYIGNTAEDGSGTYATFYLGVAVTSDGNGANVRVSNISSAPIWLTKLQIRGQGLYAFEPITSTAEDSASIIRFGRRTRQFDMPYQSNALVGSSVATFLLNVYSGDASFVQSVTFLANKSDTLMRQALTREIGDRIGVRESVTGTTDEVPGSTVTRGWFINGVKGEIVYGKYLRLSYVLTPTDVGTYWRLGVAGATELGVTTRLAYGFFRE